MLHSVEQQTVAPSWVIVVDTSMGASSDELPQKALRNSTLEIIRTGNIGPAGAFALGMQHVFEHHPETEWIVLLDDDDPPVTTDALERLLAFADERLLAVSNLAGVGLRGARFSGRRARATVPSGVGAVDVDHLHGGYLPMYRRSFVESVGVFDSDLFWGFEELEFGLRLTDANGVLLMDATHLSEVEHLYSKLQTPRGPRIGLDEPGWGRYYKLRNLLVVLRRRREVLGTMEVVAVRALGKPLIGLLTSPRRSALTLRLNLRAIGDAWTSRLGRTIDPTQMRR